MSGWTAINLENDDHSDDEVDNTKEIQIEEAFKLYQIALNIHKQGPASHSQAEAAYKSLLSSEVFSYPESITELSRADDQDLDVDPSILQDTELSAPSDEIPNTLPQILYLGHKNYGLLILDKLKHALRQSDGHIALSKEELIQQARAALFCFGRALASDESDTDLWRFSARVARFLGSRRVTRYALEAAVETDDDPALGGEVMPPSLGEGFAGIQLKDLLEGISDEVALDYAGLRPYRTKTINDKLKKYMDPYPFLPDTAQETTRLQTLYENHRPDSVDITVADRSWQGVGSILCRHRLMDSSATRFRICVPPSSASKTIQSSKLDNVINAAQAPSASNSPTPMDQSVHSADSTEAAMADAPEPVSNTLLTANLPTRKRSHSTVAGADTPDEEAGAAKRSKRIRNREAGGDGKSDLVTEELNILTAGDTHLFNFVNEILQRLGVNDLGTLQGLKDAMVLKTSDTPRGKMRDTALRDFRSLLGSWDDSKATAVLAEKRVDDVYGSARGGGLSAGMATFLEHSKSGPRVVNTKPPFPPDDGLDQFIAQVEQDWMPLQRVIIFWLSNVYKTYREYMWSDDMKITVIRLVTYADAEIYEYFSSECERLGCDGADLSDLAQIQEMVQMLFELHLDVYTRITRQNSIVDMLLRIQERDRLDRWLALAGDVQNAVDQSHLPLELELRYHWARAFYAKVQKDVPRAHMISMWTDQRDILAYANNAKIELQNNAVMPEISSAAAAREISQLTSKDMFMKLFSVDHSDHTSVIQTLEPVLDPFSVRVQDAPLEQRMNQENDNLQPEATSEAAAAEKLPYALRDMWKFLQGSSAAMRLTLWTRLREAYQGIDYTTKVFSCHLKSIELIVADIHSQMYVDLTPEARCQTLLHWIRMLDDLLVKALTIALNDATAFDIIDEAHIQSSSSALARLSKILHCAAIFDDETRLGFVQMPKIVAYGPHGTFNVFFNKLKEMQVRTWALQYTIIKDGMSQTRDKFSAQDNELAEYMGAVHYALGLRKWCKVSNKIFLKMMKLEMVRLKNVDCWEYYLGQVLFDLYGVKLGAGKFEIQDHGCPTEPLDKRTSHHIMPLVANIANRMPIKDLMRSDLRATIERMQQAIGATKASIRMIYNSNNYGEYLKSPVIPLRLQQSLKGEIFLDSLTVLGADTPMAQLGWFFLQGNVALTKFKIQTQKRSAAGALDDLRIASSFFKLQLQFTPEHWETWYRLAQCADAELEENVLWSAEKMNDDRQELIQLQRCALLNYMMAVSTAKRNADASAETFSKLSNLYRDFGMRIYASSREPFRMEAFYLDEFDRHFTGLDGGMYKKAAYEELSRFGAWKFALQLFRLALAEKPDDWHLHYMRGKCLWKMYHKFFEERNLGHTGSTIRPTVATLISVLKASISTVPKRDSRQEPILEPHYKIISIVQKLVWCGDIDHQEGADILQNRPHSIRKGEKVEIRNAKEWEEYILESLRQLRNADKSNWHHRMIMRHANIVHDVTKPDPASAFAARQILSQTMFTKTWHVQVWKPDFERPGRHYVYMERYVRYMVKLLFLLDEKTHLDLLARRVRKQPMNYFKFVDVWTDCCTSLYKLIRRQGGIPMDRDEAFKTVARDEYPLVSDRLSAWISDPNNKHAALDSLREIVELKKLNAGCMKTAPLDDLINDVWAVLYFEVGVHLPAPQSRPKGPMSLGSMMNADAAVNTNQDASRSTKLGISRREILRSAETAVNRVSNEARTVSSLNRRPMASSIILSSHARTPSLGTDNKIVVMVPNSGQASTPTGEKDMRDADRGVKPAETGREQSSEPGSVHDSADDESDLSDVPDMDNEEDAIFPDLARPGNAAKAGAQDSHQQASLTDPNNAALYARPRIVRGLEKLHPVPLHKHLPPWEALPVKEVVLSADGTKRFKVNDTVWILVKPGHDSPAPMQKLARILDIRSARAAAAADADATLLIVSWYWSKNELAGAADARLAWLARSWPASEVKGTRNSHMLSNHRDLFHLGALSDKADLYVKRNIVPNFVLLCDGVEPALRPLHSVPLQGGWLERGRIHPEGVGL